MRRLGLVVAFGLGGCFDFSGLEHVRDLGTRGADLGSNVLVSESFDHLDTTLWDDGDAPDDAFSIDTSTFMEGTGALAIDVTKLSMISTGELQWVGSDLPSAPGSRHLRFYARYEGDIDNNVDLGELTQDDGAAGEVVSLVPVSKSDPSQGASVVNNDYPSSFTASGKAVSSGHWHCYELAVTQIGGQARWQGSLSVDGTVEPAATVQTTLTKQVTTLAVGFQLALVPQHGATQAWVDAVVLTDDDATIGCL